MNNKKNPSRLRKIIKCVFACLGIIIAASAVFVFTKYDFSNPEDLDLFLERKFKKMRAAGLAVTIVEGGEVTYFKGLGYADVENKKEITQDTIFQIASTSKLVTGAAVMQLYEKGLLDVDADINGYLPVKIENPNHPETAITARMLLTHTSSIKDNYDIYDALYTIETGGGDSPISLSEFAQGYFLDGGQWYDAENNYSQGAPGTVYEYTNCGYGLLGYLVEEITGQSFSDYCRENIFEPLDMENTGWLLSEEATPA